MRERSARAWVGAAPGRGRGRAAAGPGAGMDFGLDYFPSFLHGCDSG